MVDDVIAPMVVDVIDVVDDGVDDDAVVVVVVGVIIVVDVSFLLTF